MLMPVYKEGIIYFPGDPIVPPPPPPQYMFPESDRPFSLSSKSHSTLPPLHPLRPLPPLFFPFFFFFSLSLKA